MPNPLRWVTVWAAVILLAIGSVWWSQQQAARRSCEFGNDFRRQDLPAAFEQTIEDVAAHYGEDPDEVAAVVAENRRSLDQLFPARDC